MDKNDYFENRKIDCAERIDAMLDELPPFCREFFVGTENATTPLTRLNYAYDLRIFFDFLTRKRLRGKAATEITLADLDTLSSTDLEQFLSYLTYYEFRGREMQCNERAKARKLATVRSLFRYFFNKDKLEKNVAAKVPTPKLHDKEIVRLETAGEVNEVARLLTTAETGRGLTRQQLAFHEKTHVRDLALLSLFLGTGIRISELVGLNLEDVDFSQNAFRVTRKGGNQAILYFSDEVAADLKAYVEVRGTDPDVPPGEKALFLSLQKRRISPRAVENLVKKYARIVTPLKKITPHKLRSTYGTALYRETKDIYVVAEVLGHKDVNTTKKHYAAISDDIRREASTKVRLHDDDDDEI